MRTMILLVAALCVTPADAAPLVLDQDLARATRDGRVPDAWATRSPDGRWTLVLTPAGSWQSAELSVVGVQTVDLGPAVGGQPVRVEGTGAGAGELQVQLQAALPDGGGVTWRFPIEPASVPVSAPATANAPPSRGLFKWLGWGRR
jgi:hypothetical protein